ncbi:threonine--tRNA ligase [Ureaplasma canigenitalium]|uniref:threonine--tRNA ligase n=1 Tax=Ureaplasma canigenitalium TaxID=42092 RepID=UPI0004E159B7|nr:threonine--tRNA ligase [Ureaplasma canigenitalium]
MYKFIPELNHSAAHVLAYALTKLYPGVKLWVGPAIEEGFYYDFKLPEGQIITQLDLQKIEKQMQKVISGAYEFIREEVSYEKALELFKMNEYKIDLINKYKDELITVYHTNDWIDLCRGGHVNNTKEIKAFKLLSFGGSYYQGDKDKDQLTRIYGVAFTDKEQLEEYLVELNDRKERDHRKIGKELELFTFNNLAGQGLPIWLPHGTIIKKQVEDFINHLQDQYDFERVMTPILGSIDLYKKSGHWEHYQENIFKPIEFDNEQLILRPMTCPHHILVYQNNYHSYKSLPLRLCEHSILHRYEHSGGLTGFERVREMILEDCHVFLTIDQIKQEVSNAYQMICKAHEGLNIKIHEVHLSLNDEDDTEKFHKDPEMWNRAQDTLIKLLDELKINYKIMKGEAAFYGPKIDFQVKTALNRIITISTIQLDFLLPKKFELRYIDSNNEQKTPVMIHIGIIGTYERFLAIFLEQTKGILPLWLTPRQVVVIPVNNNLHFDKSFEITKLLKKNGIRCFLDDRDERLGKKIREAQISKVAYQIVIGDEELQLKDAVTYRKYGSINQQTMKTDEFISMLKEKIDNKLEG